MKVVSPGSTYVVENTTLVHFRKARRLHPSGTHKVDDYANAFGLACFEGAVGVACMQMVLVM
jgi:hypothetical protein